MDSCIDLPLLKYRYVVHNCICDWMTFVAHRSKTSNVDGLYHDWRFYRMDIDSDYLCSSIFRPNLYPAHWFCLFVYLFRLMIMLLLQLFSLHLLNVIEHLLQCTCLIKDQKGIFVFEHHNMMFIDFQFYLFVYLFKILIMLLLQLLVVIILLRSSQYNSNSYFIFI